MARRYTSRDEAIQREIVEPIGDVADYDIEAIAQDVLGGYADGYACKVEVDEFWRVVAEKEL